MAQIKDTAAIAEKWARVTPGRSAEYLQGVKNPRTPWAAATAGANDNWKAGVQQAAANNAFSRGVAAAGDQTWQNGAVNKGPARFVEGVSIGQPDFQAGFSPYADVIRNTQLPPRFPAGDPRNLKRVEAIAQALRKKRVGS